jgi:tRNA dimethylallyltransferase
VGSRPGAVLIAGPTASGKTAAAIAVARRLGGVVVNADSMQVYADLRVLTARPGPEETGLAPHELFGFVDGADNFSVGRWLDAARGVLSRARERGATPIFVGGTGLYFKAMIRGLSNIPAVPDDVRARVRAETAGFSAPEIHARLAERDPLMAAKLRPSDPQRCLRALEVAEATGQSLAAFQGARAKPLLDIADCASVFLSPPPAELAARIDARFDAMMARGALEEVRALEARGLDPALPVMRAHGAPGLIAYLRGETSLEEAVARGKGDTRRYARRQRTFARHQLPEFSWVEPDVAADAVLTAWG